MEDQEPELQEQLAECKALLRKFLEQRNTEAPGPGLYYASYDPAEMWGEWLCLYCDGEMESRHGRDREFYHRDGCPIVEAGEFLVDE